MCLGAQGLCTEHAPLFANLLLSNDFLPCNEDNASEVRGVQAKYLQAYDQERQFAQHRVLPSLKNDPHGFVVSLFPEASKEVKDMEKKLATMEKKLKEMKETESPKQRTPSAMHNGAQQQRKL